MAPTRRDTLLCSAGTLLALGLPASVLAGEITADMAVSAFAKGAEPQPGGGVVLTLGAVAEDGFKVPVGVAAPGAEAILIVAPENPVPPVALARFGPLAGDQRFETRIRLARTQEVLALARMPDGRVFQTSHPIRVVVGGCGA